MSILIQTPANKASTLLRTAATHTARNRARNHPISHYERGSIEPLSVPNHSKINSTFLRLKTFPSGCWNSHTPSGAIRVRNPQIHHVGFTKIVVLDSGTHLGLIAGSSFALTGPSQPTTLDYEFWGNHTAENSSRHETVFFQQRKTRRNPFLIIRGAQESGRSVQRVTYSDHTLHKAAHTALYKTKPLNIIIFAQYMNITRVFRADTVNCVFSGRCESTNGQLSKHRTPCSLSEAQMIAEERTGASPNSA